MPVNTSGCLVSRNRYSSLSNALRSLIATASRYPLVPAKMIATCFSTASGSYCGCLRISTSRAPRVSWAWVDLSRSLPNCAKAASSRYCARSRRSVPATWRMALICADPPTRDTELPTLMAGRTPWWKRSDSRKICPSVIEITFVGMYAERSPACVSMIGSAVSEPPPSSVLSLAARSRSRECR